MFELYGWIKNKYLKLTRVLLISKRIFKPIGSKNEYRTDNDRTANDRYHLCVSMNAWMTVKILKQPFDRQPINEIHTEWAVGKYVKKNIVHTADENTSEQMVVKLKENDQ